MTGGDQPRHPDRRATTLAQRRATGPDEHFELPGPDSADARVDWKLLVARVERAIAIRGTDAARARLAALVPSPDILAGTVQDGCARGAMVAYEEAESLCDPRATREPKSESGFAREELVDVVVGRDLRKRREFVVRSGKAHVRFSRKLGVTLVDRTHDVVCEDSLRFDDRAGSGDLDAFVPIEDRRARVFAPNFLRPERYEQSKARTRLLLSGRLGRRPNGFDCILEFEGRADSSRVRMTVRIDNRSEDHRLRIRFKDDVAACVYHAGTPAWQRVHANGTDFVCATLLRASGQLRVDEDLIVPTPAAQCIGWVEHTFELGGDAQASADADASAWLAAF